MLFLNLLANYVDIPFGGSHEDGSKGFLDVMYVCEYVYTCVLFSELLFLDGEVRVTRERGTFSSSETTSAGTQITAAPSRRALLLGADSAERQSSDSDTHFTQLPGMPGD